MVLDLILPKNTAFLMFLSGIKNGGSPIRVMVYSKKEYLAREQDAPTVSVKNIIGQCTTMTMHHHQNYIVRTYADDEPKFFPLLPTSYSILK